MLSAEQILDLVKRRRLLLHKRMNGMIERKEDRSHRYSAAVAEYVSLELLVLSIETGRVDVWDVARPEAGDA